jgi:hypothetical protein
MQSRGFHPGVMIITIALLFGLVLVVTGGHGSGGSPGQTPIYVHGYSGGFHDDDGTGDGSGVGDDGGGGDDGG